MALGKKINGDRKILICDDDKTVSDFLKRFLEKEGYSELETAASGEEVLEKIRKDDYQLVFLDIKLPGIGGMETLKRVKEFNKDIGVIMITGFPEMSLVEQATKLGAYDYIVKPFDLAYLKLVVLTKVLLDSK
jgi:DNA-binding NtrC family response regulator